MKAKLTYSLVPAALLALAAGGLATKTEPAMAQQAAEEIDEIIVEAPIQRREVGRSSSTGARIEVIELRRRVSYADLDLGTKAGVAELETRIESVAAEACDKLSEMFPLTSRDKGDRQRCIDKAVHGTEPQVEAAIAAVS